MMKKQIRIHCLLIMIIGLIGYSQAFSQEVKTAKVDLSGQKVDGYKGIWFILGKMDEYGSKYSGGLATYTAKHIPLSIYSEKANKTFFVYGGTTGEDKRYLLCMIGSYDHSTGTVSKPVVVYDKKGVNDPHDNPSLAMDDEGYLWVFVSGRAKARPGFKYRSDKPYSTESFTMMTKEEMTYPQPKYISGKGFLNLFTKYTGIRELYFETSKDGLTWSNDQKIAGMKMPGDTKSGHYQASGQLGEKVVFFCNWHPNGNVDKRTNLYYYQTVDFGKTWTTIDGEKLNLPISEVSNPGLVREYFSKGKNVYVKDVSFDEAGNPIALYVVSNGANPGPENGLRDWFVTYWNGKEWIDRKVTTSDHNYDMGSLITDGNKWTVVAPVQNSPQKWGGGGEVVMYETINKGVTWKRNQITKNSIRNHNYIRKSVGGKDPFLYFWSDGNPLEFSKSQMYFGDSKGQIWQLPFDMKGDNEKPVKLK